MDSDDDFQPLPSSPIVERKLKRLKKASRVSENPPPSSPPIKFPQFENNSALEDSIAGSAIEIESLVDKNVTETVEEDDLGAKRVLEFDSVDYELDEQVTEKTTLDEKVTEKTTEEFGDKNSEELEIKQPSVDDDVVSEKKENKKKKNKRIDDGDGSEKKLKESNKRKAEK
ncbi:hypothetical protein L195_g056792, partial [Trifolium pratense]